MAHIHITRHYAEKVAEQFPHLEPESVVATCTQFMRLLFGVVRKGHDVRILSNGPGVKPLSLKIYRQNFNVKKANWRALRGGSRRKRERKVRENRVKYARAYGLGKLPTLFEINP